MFKDKLVVIVIDSLVGGGAERVMLTLARSMTNDFDAKVYLIIFDQVIEFRIDFDMNIEVIKSSRLEKIPRLFSKLKYYLYAKKLEKRFQIIEKQENKKINLILSNLLQSDRALTFSQRNNIYFIIHNQQSIKLKLNQKPRFEAKRRIKIINERYNNKNVICVSKGVEDDLLNHFKLKPKFIQTIYNPFEIDKIQNLMNEKVIDLPSKPYLVAVSSFKKQKNIPRLLEAFYRTNINTHQLVIIGKGNDAEIKPIKKLIQTLGIQDSVLLLGFRENPYPYIKTADLLILSSDFEGFGNVIVESLMCKTMVVSTNCPSGPAEILNGQLSQYLAELSSESLAGKILFALENKIEIKESDYLRFSTKQITKQYLNLTEG